MQSSIILTLICLVAAALAAPSQPQQQDQVASSDYQHEFNLIPPQSSQLGSPSVVQQNSPSTVVSGVPSSVVPGNQVVDVPQQQPPATVVVSDQQHPAVVSHVVPVSHPQHQPHQEVVHQHQHHQHQDIQQQQQHHQQAHYYSSPPAGLITVVGASPSSSGVVGESPVVGVKPQQQGVRNYENYGQPESASLPANYKPFGSWGLYIGGNPADGYYTNYYKALTSSVDKQSGVVEPIKPVGVSSSVASSSGSSSGVVSPVLRQASSSPYVGGDFYSFAYSPSDLNSGVPPQQHHQQQHHHHQVGVPSVYGAPASSVVGQQSPVVDNYVGISPYADAYATKKLASTYPQKGEILPQKELVSPPSSKGYQSRVYVYPSPAVQLAAPVSGVVPAQVHHSQQQHQAVVAYPVPVGSQIVGSQPGVEGSFGPYGVHAFTRYAVKPTVVNQDSSSYYYSYPTTSQQQHHQQQVAPAYKQQQQVYSVQQPGYYPLSFYGYPLSQLHYSQGSVLPESYAPSSPETSSQFGPEQPAKVEVDDKLVSASKPQPQQQKRA